MESTNSSTEILALKNNGSSNTLEIYESGSNNLDKSPSDQKKPTGFISTIQNYKENIKKIFKKYQNNLKILRSSALYGLIIAYFAWATHYFLKQDENDLQSSLCSGYGLLMILFAAINYFVIYYVIIKPNMASHFVKLKEYVTSQEIFKKRLTKILMYLLILIVILGYLIFDTRHNPIRLMSLSGLVVFLVLGFLFSKHPTQIDWHPVIWGLILQFVFGLLTLRWKVGRDVFECFGNKTVTFLSYSQYGAAFVYGDFLVYKEAVFVFKVLSTVYLISLIVNVLYYYGIMQKVIVLLGEFLADIMGTTICESVNSAANIFLGMTEAPFLIKPYLHSLTASELHSVMAAGFATVSGAILAGYIAFGAEASHLITASVMSAPAALCFSKLFYPETEKSVATKEAIEVARPEFTSVLDAASKGSTSALEMVVGISSNLIAFISVIFCTNGILSWFGELVGYTGESTWSIERFAGYIFIPFSYLMGVPWDECELVGRLIGIKCIINEFLAFKAMGEMTLSPRTKVIATYAICGFANPSSIGMMISAFNTLMPSRRELIIKTVVRACIAGMAVCFMTACIAALLVPEEDY